jgi:hypothetical protein
MQLHQIHALHPLDGGGAPLGARITRGRPVGEAAVVGLPEDLFRGLYCQTHSRGGGGLTP